MNAWLAVGMVFQLVHAAPEAPQVEGLEPAVAAALEAAWTDYEATMASAEGDHAEAEALRVLAAWYHAHERVAEARAAYREALRRTPASTELVYLAALLEQGHGDPLAAESGYTRVLELDPAHVLAMLRRGKVRIALGDFAGAESDFTAALAIDSGLAAAHAGRARIALERGQHDAAADAFRRALALQPDADRLHHGLGMALRGSGDIEAARRHLARRGDVDVRIDDPLLQPVAALSRSAVQYFEQARQAAQRGDQTESLRLLERAVELAPDDPTFLRAWGQQLLALGRLGKAREVLQRARAAQPGRAVDWLLLGQIAANEGRLDAAAESLAEAYRLDPSSGDVQVAFASLLSRLGRFGDAAPIYRELAEARDGEGRVEALYLLGLAEAGAGDCTAADAALDEAVSRSDGRHGWAMLALVRVRSSCHRYAVASEQTLALARRLFDAHPAAETAEALAMALAAHGRFDEAVEMQSQLVEAATAIRDGAEASDLLTNLDRYRQRLPAQRPFAPKDPLLLGLDG